MGSIKLNNNRPQLIVFLLFSSVLTHVIGQIKPIAAANSNGSPTDTSASSSQPLWSYQVKPNGYANQPAASSQTGHYAQPPPSIFDAFSGLSQRQGALSGSPFLSILPIILIAAGGMLLLLPFLTMMMASPFGGGGPFGGGFQNGAFGYPQVAAALGKKRSLTDQSSSPFGNQRGLVDIIEHVSSTIEELTKKYQPHPSLLSRRVVKQQQTANEPTVATNAASTIASSPHTTNHKQVGTGGAEETNNLSGSNANL